MLGFFGYVKDNNNIVCSFDNKEILSKKIHEYNDEYLNISLMSNNFYNNKICNNESLLIHVEGSVYNIEEINKLFNISYNNITDIFLYAYKNTILKELLNKVDGCFNAIIYDKITKKVYIVSDRYSLRPMFIYIKDGNLAFAPYMDYLLSINIIDKEIDKDSFDCFMQEGHLLGTNTWFKFIKQLKPATIMTYDINTKEVSQSYYWTFAEIKKSNITIEEAADKSYKLFKDSIKKQCNLKLKPLVALSGGYDSRLILAALREVLPECKPFIYTFGIKNCQDFINANKVCKKAKVKNTEYIFNGNNWYFSRIQKIIDIACAFSMQDLHGTEFIEETIKNGNLLISGFLGDTIFGEGYLNIDKKYWDKRPDEEFAREKYGKFYYLSDYDDEYYNIDNPIPFVWLNRGKNFINMSLYLAYSKFETCRPFFDNKIIELIASLPNDYLAAHKLYRKIVLKYYPKYFKTIPRNSDTLRFDKKDIDYRINKIKTKINSFLEKKHLKAKPITRYTDYKEWLKEDSLSKEISELLKYENSEYSKYTNNDFYKKYYQPHLLSQEDNNVEILRACSIELYLKHVKELTEKNKYRIPIQ